MLHLDMRMEGALHEAQLDYLSDGGAFARSVFTQSPRPRKRRKVERRTSQSPESIQSDAEVADGVSNPARLSPTRIASHIRNGDLTYPRSAYQGWTPPVNKVREDVAIKDLKAELVRIYGREASKEEELKFNLSQFSIYKPRTISPQGLNWWNKWAGDSELTGLHELKTRGSDKFLFDGILQYGDVKRYVQAVPFEVLSIDGYSDPSTSEPSAWIQSPQAEVAGVWYKLQDPAPEYERYHTAFQWVATFTKYFVDYVSREDIDVNITLEDYRINFYEWIQATFGKCQHFGHWIRRYGRKDFRAVVAANIDYLWKEATNVNPDLKRLTIWRECDPTQLRAIPMQLSMNLRGKTSTKTVVTEFVLNCFKDMYFEPVLQAFIPNKPSVIRSHRKRCCELGFLNLPNSIYLAVPDHLETLRQKLRPADIRVGDVVCVPRDVDSAWRDDAQIWYAYVQGIKENSKALRRNESKAVLDVLWLYRPSDTTLGNMRYPLDNELFMSDNCNCYEDKLGACDIVGKIDVDWLPTSVPAKAFVRQMYRTEDQSFITLQPSHFVCEHKSHRTKGDRVREIYMPGATILALAPPRQRSLPSLEPYIVHENLDERDQTRVRRLLRRGRDFSDDAAKPNELVWTDEIITIPTNTIHRPCHIRFFEPGTNIPTPYDRDGQADCFFILSRQVHGPEGPFLIAVMEPFPEGMNPGFDPTVEPKYPPLSMLSLFSGGGNFDRGLEEGGSLKTRWAVEWDQTALHTFKANSARSAALFLGSVDEYLRRAILGSESSLIAQIGEVEALAAGSPCQGFSILQRYIHSIDSLLNASKVASVASFIDHYRPVYAVLENVATMTRNLGKPGEQPQNVFSQLLCTLVAMGYQVNQYLLEAWAFGGPQSRRRLFITIAAPHFTPIAHPPLTHSPVLGHLRRSLGTAANGEKFGLSRREATPFRFVSAAESTRDLPDIGDAHVRLCVQYPDHRLSIGGAPVNRLISQAIPTYPRGQSLPKAIVAADNGTILPLPGRVLEYFSIQSSLRRKPESNSWSRLDPNGLFPTILTKIIPADAMSGHGSLHWAQPRPLTVMEARRAQGFPDEEVIIGRPADQWKIIGNSVARQVALALGMQIRIALLANPLRLIKRSRKAALTRSGTSMHLPVSRSQESESQTFEAPNRPLSPEVVIPVRKFTVSLGEDEVEKPSDNGSLLSNIVVSITDKEQEDVEEGDGEGARGA